MQWQHTLALYGLALPLFAVVELVWIGVLANSFYAQQVGHLRGDVNWLAAIAFYLTFMAGLTYFVLYPAAQAESVARALLVGGFYGFCVYAAYDLTNMATLRDWPLLMTVVDVAWGAILTAGVSGSVVWLFLKLV